MKDFKNQNIKVIGFDADDTLWVNENYFREAESAFCQLLAEYQSSEVLMKKLYEVEVKNLELYGFGIKGFTLSMMEAALEICGLNFSASISTEIIRIGKEMLDKPVVLLDQVEDILRKVRKTYRVILVTKGDLLDQHRKLEKSGLEGYFHHIEVMNKKSEADYRRLVSHLDLYPEEFLMIGNSLKSDIIPVLNIGSNAIYVPYEITWQHEVPTEEVLTEGYIQVEALHDILRYI
ncbi:HAD family hydrolase [Fulvivirga sediminis]|uniref:HAD family hydrolase n=1 Tax=Fulvivirga sediminis TaxID=2803949 RepID=A0A937F1J2_9BACT|nr:HAD family hydrolase [Fulvivirga sediminis]MBL3654572.1 HAD family hydrolase [Fulvivirga sediminis]